MSLGFLAKFPWFGAQSKDNLEATIRPMAMTMSVDLDQPKQKDFSNAKLWGWSLLSVVPWAINARDKIPVINRELKRHAQPRGVLENGGGSVPVRFRPYVSKVPWHTGARAFLSQLFPRYGHYCGPNWSSGKDSGSLVWDRRPIDWLDYCCYCHDMGYDTHDQAKLLKADLAFLECLEKPHMATKGDAHTAHVYKTMCTTGLKNLLIPYRKHLIKLQSGEPLIGFQWLSNVKWRIWVLQKTRRST